MSNEKKILRLNMQAFDAEWHLKYATIHLKDNWSPAPWEEELMYFVIDWLSESETITAQTSGSTGVPKKILLSKKNMEVSARMTLDFFGLKAGDKVLLCLPMRYIAAKMMVVRAFTGKLDLYCIEPKLYPYSKWTSDLDFAAMTSAQVEKLIETEEGTDFLHKIKKLLLGGSAISSALEEKLSDLPTKVYHSYGMTETMSHIALRKVNGRNNSEFFMPLPGVKLSQNSTGCLHITAPHLGVYDLETHDVAEFSGDGRFRILGRTDNIINSGGVKLHPEQIELKLSAFISADFFIGSQPDSLLGERPILVIESETWPEQEIAQLQQQMRQQLDKFEIPGQIIFRKAFDRTESGKIVRKH
ncbi:MAG: O-succinylbenzoic acid--CoA ligase [bacterium]|nr:MAG: O-succinylbenzoic acid--CoA ligase [bacterium]